MANFIVSYDLNGSSPSHSEVDAVLEGLGGARGRILETVWWVGYSGSQQSLFDAVRNTLSPNDRLFVGEVQDAIWQNLLIDDQPLLDAWADHRSDGF